MPVIDKKYKLLITGKEKCGIDFLKPVRKLLRKNGQYFLLGKIERILVIAQTLQASMEILERYFTIRVREK